MRGLRSATIPRHNTKRQGVRGLGGALRRLSGIKTAPAQQHISKRVETVAKKTSSTDDDVIVIKKYANRRLYNTATSSYVTLEHLCEMVKQSKEFVVRDAKTGEDITRSGQNLLPINFLRQLIRFYGDSLQSYIPSYLEMSMNSFSREQEKLRNRLVGALGGRERLGQFEDQIRQNLEVFDNAMKMFSPFGRGSAEREAKAPSKSEKSAEKDGGRENDLEELKRQIALMQAQLEALSKK